MLNELINAYILNFPLQLNNKENRVLESNLTKLISQLKS